MARQAIISQITRCSLHDGPGIRTVVYLKGCNLRCLWCHNPENQSALVELLDQPSRCIRCGRCLTVCSAGSRVFVDGQNAWDRERCRQCLQCAAVCPNEAIVVCGQAMTEQTVYNEILKDRDYYAATGGGVTFSGGECLLQPDFVRATASLCQAKSIHTAVESAFSVPWSSVECVLAVIDLFLIDIKHPDNAVHKQLTGKGNRQILDNISRLSRCHPAVNIRVPLIPTANDSRDSLHGLADIINTCGRGIQTVELLRYNNLAEGKYRALGRPFHGFADHPQVDAALEASAAILRSRLRDDVRVLY